MQTASELKYKLLNQHGDEYRSFTRLILSLSVACITIIASSGSVPLGTEHAFYSAAFSLLSLSILFGVIVQHRIMMNPLWQVHQVEKLHHLSGQNQEAAPIELRRAPSKIERICFRLQTVLFVGSFLCLALHFITYS